MNCIWNEPAWVDQLGAILFGVLIGVCVIRILWNPITTEDKHDG